MPATTAPEARPLPDALVLARLVPPTAPGTTAVPAGFTLVESDLSQGLPARFPLTPALTLTLVFAAGTARPWLRAPADAVATSSEQPGAARPGALLALRADGRFAGAIPLTAGLTRLLPNDPALPVRLAVRVLSWNLTAACVVGQGAHGSWLRLAWRPVGGAAAVADQPARRPGDPLDPAGAAGYGPLTPPSAQRDWR